MQVISAFLLVSIVFIPIGVASLFASQDVCLTQAKLFLFHFYFYKCLIMDSLLLYQVVEIIDRYETECIPLANRTNKIGYIQSSVDKTCTRTIRVRLRLLFFSFYYYLCCYHYHGSSNMIVFVTRFLEEEIELNIWGYEMDDNMFFLLSSFRWQSVWRSQSMCTISLTISTRIIAGTYHFPLSYFQVTCETTS